MNKTKKKKKKKDSQKTFKRIRLGYNQDDETIRQRILNY